MDDTGNPDYSVIEFIRSTTIGNAKDLSGTGLKIDSLIVYDEYYYLIRNDDIGVINVLHYAENNDIYGSHDGLLRRRMMEYNIYFNNDYTYYENTEMAE